MYKTQDNFIEINIFEKGMKIDKIKIARNDIKLVRNIDTILSSNFKSKMAVMNQECYNKLEKYL